MAQLYYPDGRIEEVSPSGTKFTLEELQTLVGGDIQAVRCGRTYVYCDENGKMKNSPPNLQATAEATRRGWKRQPGDFFVGCVLFT